MTKCRSLILGGVAALAFSVPALAEEVTGSTVIATVNGEGITLAHLVAARMALPEQYQALPDDVLYSGLMEQLIQQLVLAQAMGEVSNRVQIQLENDRRAIIAGEMIDGLLAKAVTDEALQAAYDEQFADMAPVIEYNASHILVETEDAAKALIVELDAGADFAELAKARSTGPSGPNGGELGWFSEGMMVQPFEDAVKALEVGQISAPVQTQFGWHVVKLNDTREQPKPTLDEVREDLVAMIENTAVEQAIAALTATAQITRIEDGTIDASTIRNDTLVD